MTLTMPKRLECPVSSSFELDLWGFVATLSSEMKVGKIRH